MTKEISAILLVADQVSQMIRGNNQNKALEHFRTKLRPKIDSMSRAMTDFVNNQESQFETKIEKTKSKTQNISSKMYLLVFLTFILGAGLSLFLSNYLIKRVKDVLEEKKIIESKVIRLSSQLRLSQEEERQRLAKELHDGIGQTLVAAMISFKTYIKDTIKYKKQFQTGLSFLTKASTEMREVYTGLFPSILTDFGLSETIRWYANHYLKLQQIETELYLDADERIPKDIEINLYRIIQELFSNIVKYANASKVIVNFKVRNSFIELAVSDNGIGFNTKEVENDFKGFGLANISQRVSDLNGEIDIKSSLDKGATISMRIPLL